MSLEIAPKEHREWAVFDLDGTLADSDHRLHHLELGKHGPVASDIPQENWDRFYAAAIDDPSFEDVTRLYRILANHFWIAILTYRHERVRSVTKEWLKIHRLPFDRLIMLPDNDVRHAPEWKRDVILEEFHAVGDRVAFLIDDHPRVISEIRKIGVTAFEAKNHHTRREG